MEDNGFEVLNEKEVNDAEDNPCSSKVCETVQLFLLKLPVFTVLEEKLALSFNLYSVFSFLFMLWG